MLPKQLGCECVSDANQAIRNFKSGPINNKLTAMTIRHELYDRITTRDSVDK